MAGPVGGLAGGQTLRALRKERGRAGRAGNVPTVRPWAAAFRVSPYLCCRSWAMGELQLTGPWLLRVTGWSALVTE